VTDLTHEGMLPIATPMGLANSNAESISQKSSGSNANSILVQARSVDRHTRLRLRGSGLRQGGLPYQMALLSVGDSVLVETTKAGYKGIYNRYDKSRKTPSLSCMKFDICLFHAKNIADDRSQTYIAKITRVPI
jgi:hypothetical protein